VDGILIPNGTILPNEKGGAFDFWSAPKKMGANLTSPDLVGGCGSGCIGYDTAFLVNRAQNGPYDWREAGPVAVVGSPFSGIQIDIFTDQDAFQIYSCPGQNCKCLCECEMRNVLTLVNSNHRDQRNPGLLQ
jgi:aldose 1-epimerase